MTTDGSAQKQSRLLEEFPYPTPDEWRQLVEKDLKGVPFEKKLVTKTYEGIDIQPIYNQEQVADLPYLNSLPGFPPYLRGTTAAGYLARSWDICQELPYSAPAAWNEAARHDLERGQTALNLALDAAIQRGNDPDPAQSNGYGLALRTLDDLAQALAGIDLEKTPLFVQAGVAGLPLTALLGALARQQGAAPAALRGCIAMDPLGTLAGAGTLPIALSRAYDEMAQATSWAKEQAPHLQTIAVHSHVYHDGGGNAVQELAFAIATAVEYIRALQDRGLDINDIAACTRFALSIGGHFFMEIAKLRAARLLWAQIVDAFGGSAEAQKLTIHARTARWNVAALDAHTNLLRATVETFAGIAGSCDSIHVGCFDEALHLPDEFSRRTARNTQLILGAEAHLDKVIDPAGGSWYVETLTDTLARKAWTLFQEVEKQGGMAAALQAGFPQQQVAQVAAQRKAALATRKDVLVGVNMYPNLNEKPLPTQPAPANGGAKPTAAGAAQSQLDRLRAAGPGAAVEAAIEAALAGATVGAISAAVRAGAEAGPTIEAIALQRGAEAFEALRAAANDYATRTGARPKVFLATMGPVSQHKARADFSTGFFQVGGFDVVSNNGFATAEAAAQAAVESGAPVVVICSTDDTYPELVPPLTSAIKTARPDTLVILAGYPADQVESHKAAGIDEFIHLRADIYRVLSQVMQRIGVMA